MLVVEVQALSRTCKLLSPHYVGIPVKTITVLSFAQMPATGEAFWPYLSNAEACVFASTIFKILQWAHVQTRYKPRSFKLPQCMESDPERIAWYDLWTRFRK